MKERYTRGKNSEVLALLPSNFAAGVFVSKCVVFQPRTCVLCMPDPPREPHCHHCKVLKETGKRTNLLSVMPTAIMKCYFWLVQLCGYTYFSLLWFIVLPCRLFLLGICNRSCSILNHSYAAWNTTGLENKLVQINRASSTFSDLWRLGISLSVSNMVMS